MRIRALLLAIVLLALAGFAGAADPRGELRVGIPWTPRCTEDQERAERAWGRDPSPTL